MSGQKIRKQRKEFWVNIVDFIQQYWAVIERKEGSSGVKVYILRERSGILATLDFDHEEIARKALVKNGFKNYNDPYENFGEYLHPPRESYLRTRKKGKSEVS